jgi:hypothetical protein
VVVFKILNKLISASLNFNGFRNQKIVLDCSNETTSFG